MKDMNKSPKNKDSFVILIKYQLWGWRRCGGLKWSESLPLDRQSWVRITARASPQCGLRGGR